MEINKILVTGASGYIGRHVVRELLNQGYDVIASDLNYKGVDERAEFSDVELFSGDKDIYEQFGRPDVLIHMAWRDGFIHNSDAHMHDLSKHMEFLTHMIDGGIKLVSVMGSMHEIGYYEGAIKADTPCNPQSMYGIAKNALRQALLLYGNGKDVIIDWLRAYYIFGDDSRGSSIFAKIVQAVDDGKKTFPFTSGKNLYDFVHVDELAKMISASSTQDEVRGIINVCTGKPVSLSEQVEKYIADNGYDIRLEYGKFPDRPYDSPGVWGDASDINKIMCKKYH